MRGKSLNRMSWTVREPRDLHQLTLPPDARSYVPPVPVDGLMRGAVVAVVTQSKSAKFPIGAHLYAPSGWTEYAVLDEKTPGVELVVIPSNGKVTDALGVLGMTGLTAYFGLLEVGQVKAGDFVVVSGAAGATGSVVGQIAKLKGATVLGIAGSDDKVQWLKDLGFDDALNYRDPAFAKKFRAATPKFIDVFFDNGAAAPSLPFPRPPRAILGTLSCQ
jgi:NADPH-dependent curcumin reductase CurA